MKRLLRFVQVVVVLECLAGAWWCARRLARPALPLHYAAILDPITSRTLGEFRANLSPDQPENWSKLAEMYLTFGSYRAAEAFYAQSDRLMPNRVETLLGWGVCLERLGRLADANAVLQRAAERAAPSLRAEIRYRIGRNHQRADRAADAEQAFQAVDNFFPASYQTAKLLLRADRPSEALPHIERMLKAGPEVMEFNQLAELCHRRLDQPDRAAVYREKLERCPTRLAVGRTVAAFHLLRRQWGLSQRMVEADRLEKSGRHAEACELFETAWQAEPSEPAAAKIAELRLHLGEPDAALDMCLRQAEVGGASAKLLALMGAAYDQLHQPDQAVALWERATSLRIEANTCLDLANASDVKRDADAARRYRALAEFAEGLRLYHANQLPPALGRMQAAVELNPDHAPAWFYLGTLQSLTGQGKAARASWQRCVTLDPAHGRAFAALARAEINARP